MQQLPNVKDETCKIKTVLRLCQRGDTERQRTRGRQKDEEETDKKRQETEEKSPNRLCFNYWCRKGGEKQRFLLVRLSLWIKHYIYISD